ncbi:DUF6250 domain-containing protein [Coraliomargarita sp. SDUM461004]|uniref:DUF6250 domain-containing protein n=1 Tax=Thalassobacterium sedimentorum TaxID=3041258 RepID=A0ABU1AHN2_9BACT|nr:DUF6250 domain-containing protein [Coraliomargarita sp. SDUM461004]MDQ8194327.1 DUF6250 domain-containing protein [Coraliomargarita sp. SDUM461004]
MSYAKNDSQPLQSVEPVVVGYGVDAFTIGELLYETDFKNSQEWEVQIQASDSPMEPRVVFDQGMLDIYMPARGSTVWLKHKFEGPIAIVYQVRCPEDTLSFPEVQARDINNFWHASDPEVADGLFDASRYDGAFRSYHKLHGYYASTGGGGATGNQTTRFRRYPRQDVKGNDVQHIALNDRDGQADYLISPGKWHTVQLVAAEGIVQYLMDGRVFYEMKPGDLVSLERGKDPVIEKAYTLDQFPAHTAGYFGFRLVRSHHQYTDFKVYRLNVK